MYTGSIICNLLTAVLVVGSIAYSWKKSRAGKVLFRYFTVLSNLFCAGASLAAAAAECAGALPSGILLLKYTATVSVSVTCVTVLVFLMPVFRVNLLKGADFFLHLFCPVLAAVSFCGVENQAGLPFRAVWLSLLPVFLYGLLYLYRVVFCDESRRWEDFYGFNRGGMWPVSFVLMLIGTFLLGLVIRAA